ncbi:MAG: hypothetical protein JNJ45_07845 [Chthonomonas sp.]|nr:hypothetical protein [Chthonomonas sp.]
MKKLISIFLVLGVLGSALVGCGGGEKTEEAAAPAATAGAGAEEAK